MANRRMFSKTITGSSAFLMMPPTSRLLYYDLGMNADDDGFCEHYTVMKMTDAKPDDLRVLQAKGFVKVFDDRVLIILDWKENNYLRSDRYTKSKYLEIYREELKLLSSGKTSQAQDGVPVVYQMDTQDRLGKDRLGKEKPNTGEAEEILSYWNEVFGTKFKSIKGFQSNFDYWHSVYSMDEIKEAIRKAKQDKFWADKIDPVILFRRKNPRGESVDLIGRFLNSKEQKEFSNSDLGKYKDL